MTAKCKTCGQELPAETIERMLERFDRFCDTGCVLLTDAERNAEVALKDIVGQWPALIRGLMAKADPRPFLTPETVDSIPDSVCKAIWDGYHPPSADNPAPWGRAILRSVAAHCRVPQSSGNPGELDSAEADRIIDVILGELQEGFTEGPHQKLRQLRSRLTLKPRRLTDEEALELSEFADSRVPAEAVAGHSIAREVARLWGMEVPEERPAIASADYVTLEQGEKAWSAFQAVLPGSRFTLTASPGFDGIHPGQKVIRAALSAIAPAERPARALSDDEAEELYRIVKKQIDNASTTFILDGRFIYAEALRLAGMKVERDGETPSSGWVGPDSPASYWIKPTAPVASVELSEAIVAALSERWPNMQMEGWDDDEAGEIINRILAARKAPVIADAPPFEGPVVGFGGIHAEIGRHIAAIAELLKAKP